ncbi:MAG: hypothetical protein IKR66_05825 [Bacteroidales bacterium]|nr:hypothetical protein [Bacteroidales bacterium]
MIKQNDTMSKEAFVFYGSWCEAIKKLPVEIRTEIYEATIHYGLTGNIDTLSPMAELAFGFIKNDIDRNNKTYEERQRQRSEAGKKGNEARWGKQSQDKANNDEESQNITNHSEISQNNNNESDISQTITNENEQSQSIAKESETSQSIANNRKTSQNIANDNKPSQTSLKEKESEKKRKRNENKKISLSLTPSHSDDTSEREKERNRERENLIFKNLFWLNRKSPQKETQRLIDNYQSQGWKKANGREITDLASVVRMWKCEESDLRMPRKHLECLRKMLEAVNLHDNVNALRETDKLIPNGETLELYCTRKVGNYLQERSQAILPIVESNFPDKKLFLKYLD